jgi:hypothetical protein
MRRLTLTIGLGLLVVAYAASSAMAKTGSSSGAHYLSDPAVTVSGNTLTVSGRAAGLGNVGSVTIDLSGTVDVSSRCYTKSNNKPQANNKQESISVDQTQDVPARNGSVSFSFDVSPLSTLTCPPGQRVVLESIAWDLDLTFPLYPDLDRNLTGSISFV